MEEEPRKRTYGFQEFDKLTVENFAARLTQANLKSKTDFDHKLISFNRKITSSKAKYLEVLLEEEPRKRTYGFQEFDKLTVENFAARLTQANLKSKTDFDHKLISFNRKITSSKAKYLEVL